ncbi:MAG: thiosulfate oxidation carrier complex protein SoxZ [Amphiplicatus sp.]
MARTLINLPETARAGEIIEIKAMIAHPMETGHRLDAKGATIPRNIINRFECVYDGATVFAADLYPAVSANPFLSFTTIATKSGAIRFTWTDDKGVVETPTAEMADT